MVQDTAKEFSGIAIDQLCKLAHVSRSGYYHWLKKPITNKQRSDLMLKVRIKALFKEQEGKYGYRRITMILNRRFNYHINPKRVRRLMNELGLRSVIRKSNHSCTISRGHNYEPNLLGRNFIALGPNLKWVTDVTYLEYGNGCRAYLSAIKDLYDGEIVSYVVSKRNDNPLVISTLNKALEKNPGAHPILHSDRGFQYTSTQFARLTTKHGITRSMSRVGKCIDNAPMESFWGHYKDEAYYGEKFETFEELVKSIDDYMYFYNYERYQEKLGSLTPVEYRHQAA